jgi:fumarate hydratase subunit beta
VSEPIHLQLPLSKEDRISLKVGDSVRFSGSLYTARDAAHHRLFEAVSHGQEIPIPLQGETIYYVGPCPAPPGWVIGSAGPTTSGRMDKYTPRLLDLGLAAMIGKGERSPEVIQAMIRNYAVYFATIGGAGVLIARTVKKMELVAYPELGPEAIYRLEVENFPAVVAIDSQGRDIYREGRKPYQKHLVNNL